LIKFVDTLYIHINDLQLDCMWSPPPRCIQIHCKGNNGKFWAD